MADLPKQLAWPGLFRYYGTPWLCSGFDSDTNTDNFDCYKLNLNSDKTYNWRFQYTSSRDIKNYVPYVVRDHVYFLGDGLNSAQGPPPIPVGSGACWVPWRDNLIVLGGLTGLKAVQLFTFSTNAWTVLAPMSRARSYFGCTLLPNGLDQILVVSNGWSILLHIFRQQFHRALLKEIVYGSFRSLFRLMPKQFVKLVSAAEILDIGTNSWRKTGSTIGYRVAAALVLVLI